MTERFNLPPTTEHPDNVFADTQAISWDFIVGGYEARRGFMQPSFEGEFDVPQGGEEITLINTLDSELVIDYLGDGGHIEEQFTLDVNGDSISIPSGQKIYVTAGTRIVEYVCVYKGQLAKDVLYVHKDGSYVLEMPNGDRRVVEPNGSSWQKYSASAGVQYDGPSDQIGMALE